MFLYLLIFLIIVFLIYQKIYISKENYVGNLRVANEIDHKRAVKYAVKKLCEKNGYVWKDGIGEFDYDCKHTKKSCENESVYPTPKNGNPKYYEWRDDSDGGKCILGNESFRTFCETGEISPKDDETQKISKLRYDKSDGKCYTTRPYCNDRLLAFCNNDCFETPTSKVLTKVFGTTIGRSIGLASPDAMAIATCI